MTIQLPSMTVTLNVPRADPWYCVEKAESALAALEFERGPLGLRVFRAFSDGLRYLAHGTIPETWPDIRDSFERLIDFVGGEYQGYSLQKLLSEKSPDALEMIARAITLLCTEIVARASPN